MKATLLFGLLGKSMRNNCVRHFILLVFLGLSCGVVGQSANDNCSNATNLTVGTSCTNTGFTFTFNTIETASNPALCNGASANRDGWYTFTTGPTATAVVITATTDRPWSLSLYSGNCAGFTQVACNSASANIPITLSPTSLSPSTTYYIRVNRTNGGSNAWTGNICVYEPEKMVPATGNTSYTMCSGNLYDIGGSGGNYLSSSDGYTVINPSVAGNLVRVSGSIISESGYDYLTIYDGAGTGGTILWGGSAHGTGTSCGTFTIPTITSTMGPLTVRFYSDGSTNCAGFNLAVSCITPTACSGTPSAGTVVVSPSSGSPGSAYGVSASGYSTGSGLTYQWQYSDTGGGSWTNQGTATSSYVALTGLTAPAFGVVRTWRLVVTCTASSGSTNSTTGTFTSTYCTPTSTNTIDYISGFSTTGGVTNISNPSGALSTGGYGNFYATHSASLYPGSVLNFTETYVGGSHGFSIWVDFNNNGVFETSERLFNAGSMAAGFTGSITVPSGTSAGDYRMRVRAWYDNLNPDPCTNISYGEAEDYRLTVLPLSPCSGTPNAGVALANGVANGNGTVGSALTLSATGLSTGTGLTYQWFSSPNGTAWTPISGATTATYTTTAAATETTTYYRLVTTCANGGATNTSSNTSFFTSIYCMPTNSPNSVTFIQQVEFLGTQNDIVNSSSFSSAPNGYQYFGNLPNLSSQYQGEAVNIKLATNGPIAFMKAWIDFNKDGDFLDANELVYNSGITSQSSTTFGFQIPPALAAGNYRLRVRIEGEDGFSSFDSCAARPYSGETEDYVFTVLARCAADIETVTKGERCGIGSVTLQASTISAGVTEFRWYTAPTGGTYVTSPNVSSSTTFMPSISTTTTYYVAAFNGTCETQVRRAVVATVKDVPEVTFSPAMPIACGDTTPIEVAAEDGLETVYLVDENFDIGGLGPAGTSSFVQTILVSNGNPTNNITKWEKKTSTFIPVDGAQSWLPAISSGYGTDKFAFSTADVSGGYVIDHGLDLRNSINTTDFQNLTLKFRMYFSRYITNNSNPNAEYVSIEVSTNGGTTYTPLSTPRVYVTDIGSPGAFSTETVNLNAYINQTNLKFRIRYYSNGWTDGVAVDDIQIYGTKTLTASYSWSGSDISVYTDAELETPYTPGTAIDRVFVVPNLSLLTQPSFNIIVTSTLTNGCPLIRTIPVTNNSKVWDGTNTNFNDANNWKPVGVPTSSNCVVIPDTAFEPFIPASYNGVAKSVSVKPSASLTISTGSSITVTDEVLISDNNTPTNPADDAKLVIEDDGSLVQITDPPVDGSGNSISKNEGSIEMRRITTPMYRYDFTYWSSPVEESPSFTLYTLSPGTLFDKYFGWNTSTQNWQSYLNGASSMAEGLGYIVRAPQSHAIEGQSGATPQSYPATFIGKPNNGVVTVGVVGGTDKWNLLGNPYPSAISANAFISHSANAGLDGTLYFWTHNSRPDLIPGSDPTLVYNYTAADYAAYNLTGSTATATSATTGGGTGNNNNAPNGFIAAGQSFFVQGITTGTASFNNSMRVTGPNTNFYRTGNTTNEGRVWLNLTTQNGSFHQALVGYVGDATNNMDRGYDGVLMGGNVVTLYSLLGTDKLTIQGRQLPFSTTDEVPLGAAFTSAGTYNISIDHYDGFFANEAVYLEDRLLNVFHDLKQNGYTFTSGSGTFNNRFVLRYMNPLSKPDFETLANEVFVLNKEGKLVVQSVNENIDSIVVYDLVGRKILAIDDVHDKVSVISNILATEQTLLLQVELESGVKVTKKAIIVN